MPWAVICDFCSAPAPLAGYDPNRSGAPAPLPEGWLHIWLGHGPDADRKGLVCSGGCAVRLVARWQDEEAAARRQRAEAEAWVAQPEEAPA